MTQAYNKHPAQQDNILLRRDKKEIIR